MRLFLAANFTAALREQLYAAAAPLRDAAPTVAWVARDLLHVTLKFLGERDASLVPAVAATLRAIALTQSPFDVRLGGYGAFPNFRSPRVVWMGAEDAQPLVAIAAAIDEAYVAIGVARDARPFRAHLTLGRVKRPLDRDETRGLEQTATTLNQPFTWRVGAVDLMRSELGRAGPTYTVLESIALVAAP